MKVSFFLLKFPLSSETFVLNQITAFIDMGHEVEIVALQKGDTQHTHAAWEKYGLAAKTRSVFPAGIVIAALIFSHTHPGGKTTVCPSAKACLNEAIPSSAG